MLVSVGVTGGKQCLPMHVAHVLMRVLKDASLNSQHHQVRDQS